MEEYYTPTVAQESKQGGTNNFRFWAGYNPMNLFADKDFNSPHSRTGQSPSRESPNSLQEKVEEIDLITGTIGNEENDNEGGIDEIPETKATAGSGETSGSSSTENTSSSTSTKKTKTNTKKTKTNTKNILKNFSNNIISTKLPIADALGLFLYVVCLLFFFLLALSTQTYTEMYILNSQLFFLTPLIGVLAFFSLYTGIRGMLIASK